MNPNDSSAPRSLAVPTDAVVFNWTESSASTNGGHLSMDASQPRTTTSLTPTLCISLSDDESEDEDGCDNTTNLATHTRAAFTKSGSNKAKKRKTASKKGDGNHRRFICTFGRCKESFDSWGARKYHLNNKHLNGSISTFDCYLCKKSMGCKLHSHDHIIAMHTDLRPYKCPNQSCSKTYKQKTHLMGHIKSAHDKRKKIELERSSTRLIPNPKKYRIIIRKIRYHQSCGDPVEILSTQHILPHIFT